MYYPIPWQSRHVCSVSNGFDVYLFALRVHTTDQWQLRWHPAIAVDCWRLLSQRYRILEIQLCNERVFSFRKALCFFVMLSYHNRPPPKLSRKAPPNFEYTFLRTRVSSCNDCHWLIIIARCFYWLACVETWSLQGTCCYLFSVALYKSVCSSR